MTLASTLFCGALAQPETPTIVELVNAINVPLRGGGDPEAVLARGIDINETDAYGQTALIYLIDNYPTSGTVRRAIELGADVNHVTNAGWTPLIYAIRKGNADVVRVLLDAGAEPSVPTSGGDLVTQTLDAYPSESIERILMFVKEGEEAVLRSDAEHAERLSRFRRGAHFEEWSEPTPAARRECEYNELFLSLAFDRTEVLLAREYDPAITEYLAFESIVAQFVEDGYVLLAEEEGLSHHQLMLSPRRWMLGHTFTLFPVKARVLLTLSYERPTVCLTRVR